MVAGPSDHRQLRADSPEVTTGKGWRRWLEAGARATLDLFAGLGECTAESVES